jgi:hypothetical protein
MDKPAGSALAWGAMQKPESKLVTPASLAVDAVLVVAFFFFMYSVVSSHVPSKDHRMILIWGGAGSVLPHVRFLARAADASRRGRAQRESKPRSGLPAGPPEGGDEESVAVVRLGHEPRAGELRLDPGRPRRNASTTDSFSVRQSEQVA